MSTKQPITWKQVVIVTVAMLVGCAIVLAPQFLFANSIDKDEFEKAGAGIGALTAVGGFVGVIWKLLSRSE